MKLSKKMRLIGLSAALVLLVAIGIGGRIWFFSRDTEEAPTPEFSGVERAGMIKEGEIYQEEFLREIGQTETVGNILCCPDGMAILICRDGAVWLENLLTGEIITELSAEWLAEGQLQEVTFAQDGTLYAAILRPECLKIVNDKGNPVVEIEGYQEKVQKFKVAGGYFACLSGEQLSIYTEEGASCYQAECHTSFDLTEDGILYYLGEEFLLRAYDLKENQVLYTVPFQQLARQYTYQVFYERNADLLYVAGDKFVWAFDPLSGDYLKTAMENAKSSTVLSNGYFTGFAADQQQNLYCIPGENNNALYRYHITKDTRKDMPYTLKVTAPYRSDYMALMIQYFEKEHPEQRVEYEYAYPSLLEFERRSDQDAYFDRFRTQMLAGDVGDIVMTGGTWSDVYHYFANTELFQDLRPLIEQSELYEELDPVLLNAITIDEQIKGLPLAADYYYAMIDEGLCRELDIDLDWNNATWSDILGLLDKLEGTDYYLFDVMGNTERAFVRMLISNMPDVIDRKNKQYDLRQQWFLDLIQQWKAAEEHPNFAKKNQLMGLSGKALVSIDGRTAQRLDKDQWGAASRFYQKTGRELTVVPLFSGEKATNRTATGAEFYSVYNGSQQKEMAWELLNTGNRKELQTTFLIYGGPLNRNARQQRLDEIVNTKKQSPDPVYSQRAENFYAQLNTVYASVDTLYDMFKIKENLYKTLWAYVRKDSKVSLEETLAKAEQQLMVQLYE